MRFTTSLELLTLDALQLFLVRSLDVGELALSLRLLALALHASQLLSLHALVERAPPQLPTTTTATTLPHS